MAVVFALLTGEITITLYRFVSMDRQELALNNERTLIFFKRHRSQAFDTRVRRTSLLVRGC